MRIIDVTQGSTEWFSARCGKVTMSRAKDLLVGGKGKTRQAYIYDLVAERLSGQPADSFSSFDMDRGRFLEPYAIQAFTDLTGLQAHQAGFVLHDDERIGCSPDAFLKNSGLEIKCPRPRQHIRNVLADGFDDYLSQVQGCMWVCDRETWHLASFCPWVESCPFSYITVYRDEEMIKGIAESAEKAADEVDRIISNGFPNVLNSVQGIAMEARQAWEFSMADNDEVTL